MKHTTICINPFSASLIYIYIYTRKPQSASLDLRVKKRKKKFYSDRSIDTSFYDIELNEVSFFFSQRLNFRIEPLIKGKITM